MVRDPVLSAGLVTSLLVSAVMMTTMVVGPFYLARGLGLDAAVVGLVMSIGPLVVALAGVPAGRIADRFGAPRGTLVGLVGIAAGCGALAITPSALGIAGYVAPIVMITAGYALFQTANNTAVMTGVAPDRRGLVSGLLNLSRNLGLVTGASLMGAVFAAAAGDVTAAPPAAVATGLRVTFAVAAALIVVALAVAIGRRVCASPAQPRPARTLSSGARTTDDRAVPDGRGGRGVTDTAPRAATGRAGGTGTEAR
jgi:MFS family permease